MSTSITFGWDFRFCSMKTRASSVTSGRTNTIIPTSPRHCTSRLSKARWIRNVVPTSRSETAEVTTAATERVTFLRKFATVSRSA